MIAAKQSWKFVRRWYSIPLLLILWEIAVDVGLVRSQLLPSPTQIWTVFVAETADGVLPYHALVTMGRALSGFILAALVGIPFAAAMSRSKLWRNLFEPIFFLGYPAPKIALFPVFTYVFGFGSPSKIAFTLLECLYPIVVTCYFGFRGIQAQLIWTEKISARAAQSSCGASYCLLRCRAFLPGCVWHCRCLLSLSC